ncbi:MlaE family ABC transporter permease [Porphyromonas levii]|uniref:ABC transporter permease n=1 Tax=Porphyromonas levii TaxID=28114 RepID=A0A4Y8WNX1_9PORP|nr:ABC transporter permease [Porphyromonas levii]MBR8703185.1 Intermembrane phospholipid transport system permease protein MlaE [Porphyromonas levii]MBR8713813.1 Intermembrane phospholipid transport system permease protein MlaE [Porphyromonas levii]MBR8715653.1 Intermembrane phospholipid transport system permease protein MlaE [Porphyromonas levii]MBR8728142.1 Intermembrane phospholipid transport system permease protein MlaE [Porphyromonas levii]MBR8729896.1 Intermembrane phospholipid transport
MGAVLESIGKYVALLGEVFKRPQRMRMFSRELVREIYVQGVGSIWIVFLVSFFIGAVLTMQLGINMSHPLIPKFTIGYAAREIVILEFSSTIMCMILAGKCGSSIASQIGTMRITEQLDAMDIMGVNAANYVILPKIVGMMLFVPILVLISIMVGIGGGYLACLVSPNIPISEFEAGLQLTFKPYNVFYSIVKSVVYVFFISSLASYFGYFVKGGALEVGRASTQAVVMSNAAILVVDLVLTQLMLV